MPSRKNIYTSTSRMLSNRPRSISISEASIYLDTKIFKPLLSLVGSRTPSYFHIVDYNVEKSDRELSY